MLVAIFDALDGILFIDANYEPMEGEFVVPPTTWTDIAPLPTGIDARWAPLDLPRVVQGKGAGEPPKPSNVPVAIKSNQATLQLTITPSAVQPIFSQAPAQSTAKPVPASSKETTNAESSIIAQAPILAVVPSAVPVVTSTMTSKCTRRKRQMR